MNLDVITWEDYGDLSDREKECIGDRWGGAEGANYLRVKYKGKSIFLMNDDMESCDRSLSRGFRPLVELLDVVYEIGVKDGKGEKVEPEYWII